MVSHPSMSLLSRSGRISCMSSSLSLCFFFFYKQKTAYEMDGPGQMGHRSASDYGKFALEAAKLMKWTDPSIKLIAAGSSNFGTGIDWIGWNRTVLDYLKRHADYLAIHLYVGNRDNDYYEFLASSVDLDRRIKTVEGV